MSMKKIVLLFALTVLTISNLVAQDNIRVTLKPNESQKKEITITGINSSSFNVLLELRWEEKNNRIQLLFDRKSISGGGEDYLLCIPLMRETRLIKDVEDCMSKKKNLYKSKIAKDIKQLNYFAESNDLRFNYESCYKYVSINNELEFGIDIAGGDKEKLIIRFNGLYVLKKEKRPWYAFSSRDVRLEYKAEPIVLDITLKKDPCIEAGNLINDLKTKIRQLENLKSEAENATKAKNCFNANSELNNIKNNRLNEFPLQNAEWNKYIECKELTDLVEKYKTIRNGISNVVCVEKVIPPPKTPICNLSNVNSRLKNLQLTINTKKKNGEDIDSERNTFQNIISTTNASSDCKGFDAYESYVNTIKRLLNIK